MLGLSFDFWMNGHWFPAPPNRDTAQDIFGNAIAVGDTVKLVGTIVSMNLNDAHFQDIVVRPFYPQPVTGNPAAPISATAGVNPNQVPVITYGFHPLQLVKGS